MYARTFDTLPVTPANQVAINAAWQIATEPNQPIGNPLFIYGEDDKEKDHLRQALIHEIAQRWPDKKIVALSAEEFMYQFIQAIAQKDMGTFKSKMQSADIFIISDIEFFRGKNSTRKELEHTLDALHGRGVPIIAFGQDTSALIFDDPLDSFFLQGLSIEITHPSPSDCLAILETKRADLKRAWPNIEIPDTVLEYIARYVRPEITVLESCLNRIIAYMDHHGTPPDAEALENIIQPGQQANRQIKIEEIMRKVVEHYNLKMADMTSQRRARAVSRPRQVAMYLAKTLTTKSLPEIGRRFGGRDHTTVMHAVKQIESLTNADAQIAEDIRYLTDRLGTPMPL